MAGATITCLARTRAAQRRDAEAAARALDGLHRAVVDDLRALAGGPLQQAAMIPA